MSDWYWKDLSTQNRPNRKKKKSSSKTKLVKAQAQKSRDFCLKWFHRGSIYTDNVTLSLMICKEMNWDQVETSKQRIGLIKRFHREKKEIAKQTKTVNSVKYIRTNKAFYSSKGWLALRYLALTNSEGSCQCCGSKASDGVQIHVDHIKPRSKFPYLELDLDNIQILCSDCNIGKDNIYIYTISCYTI